MMHSLFSASGRLRLEQIVGPGLLCAFDFDGTLAPIVAHPEQAGLPEAVHERLTGLAAYAPLAIITGRSVDDVRSRLGFEPDFVIGNHGMEGMPGKEAQAAAHRQACGGWRVQLLPALGDLALAGVQLEDKRYSLSLHYRHAHTPDIAVEVLNDLFATLDPAPRIVAGKYVFNLLPADAAHKGNALEQLMQLSGARAAIYVGDDVTDEDVFRLQRPDLLSVRIEHAPDSAADFYIPDPGDILPLLDELNERLLAGKAGNWLQTASPRRA